jgi:DNA-directed RNA polymerase subunit RPC12/RpoP
MNSICKTGEKPGRGSYECTNCHTMVDLDQYDKLPPCPSCSNNEFTKQ